MFYECDCPDGAVLTGSSSNSTLRCVGKSTPDLQRTIAILSTQLGVTQCLARMEECVQHQTHVTVQVLDSLVTSVKYKVPSLLLFMSGWIQCMFFISDDTTDGERTKLQQLFLCIQWNPSMRTPLNRTPFSTPITIVTWTHYCIIMRKVSSVS